MQKIYLCVAFVACLFKPDAQDLVVRNSSSMQLMVAKENPDPTLRLALPGQPESDRAIEIIFPEHLTVRERGSTDAYQLYMFQGRQSGQQPAWKRTEHSLEYEKDFPNACRSEER